MPKEILITGMEGMAGAHLARTAIDAGYKVTGTRYPQATPDNINAFVGKDRVTVFSCDLSNPSDIKNLMSGTKPDYIFHLAGKTNNPRSWIDDTLPANITMLNNIMQEVGKQKQTPRVVLISSINVYGHQVLEKSFDENDPLMADTPYALSKTAQEKMADLYAQRLGLEIVKVRPSQHTGPGRAPGFVEYEIGEQVLKIEKREAPPKIAVRNAAAQIDLLDVRDVAKAYLLLAEKGKNGEVYNVSSGKSISIRNLAEIAIAASRIPDKNEVTIYSTGEEKQVPSGYANNKIRSLGWQPKIPLQQTIGDLLNWMREK